jgi:hypothetical protein
MLMGEARAQRLLDRLPAETRASLDRDQERAILAAAALESWDLHPVDIRLSIPCFGQRFYLAVVGGRERRSTARVKIERRARRLWSLPNLTFLLAMTLAAGLLWSALLHLLDELLAGG